jgi:hypothetical protein
MTQLLMLGVGAGGIGGAAPVSYGAWSSTYKNASVTLSSSDEIATTVSAGNRGVLGAAPIVEDETYFEVEVVSHASGNIILGVASQALKTNAASIQAGLGAGYNSNGTGSSPLNVTFTAGDRIGFAWRRSAAGLWVRKNGTWLGNDPTGAAALTVSNGVDRVFTPLAQFTSAASVQLVTDPANFQDAAPSGFVPLEAASWPGYLWSSTDKGANLTLSETQTKATKSSTGHNNVRLGTEPIKGKQVFAIELTADGAGSTAKCVGLLDIDDSLNTLMGGNGFGIGYRSGGTVVRNGSTLQTYTAWGTVGDIIMIAANGDTNELWFGLNNSWNGDPEAGTGEVGSWIIDGSQNYGIVACGATDSGDEFKLIEWPYAVPAGFTAPVPADV